MKIPDFSKGKRNSLKTPDLLGFFQIVNPVTSVVGSRAFANDGRAHASSRSLDLASGKFVLRKERGDRVRRTNGRQPAGCSSQLRYASVERKTSRHSAVASGTQRTLHALFARKGPSVRVLPASLGSDTRSSRRRARRGE